MDGGFMQNWFTKPEVAAMQQDIEDKEAPNGIIKFDPDPGYGAIKITVQPGSKPDVQEWVLRTIERVSKETRSNLLAAINFGSRTYFGGKASLYIEEVENAD